MKKVKKQTHKSASSKRHISKKATFSLFRYKWVALVGLFLLLGASFFAVHYATTGKVLSAITGPTGGGCEAYCHGTQYCSEKSVRGTCVTTGCLFVLGKCGYKFPRPKPTPRPKPKPAKDPRLTTMDCNNNSKDNKLSPNTKPMTIPYQIFGPASLAGGSDSTPTNLTGKITASICTDEINDAKSGKHVVRITTNIVFDKLAINAGVTCDGPKYPGPLNQNDTVDFLIPYQPISNSALAAYYKGGASDPSNPVNRKPVSCPGTNQLAFQFSPDTNHFGLVGTSQGSTYKGRLLFTLNFHQYGYSKDIDIWTNTIKVK